MDDTSRDPAITEDEIRALQFSAGDVAEIEQTGDVANLLI